jgi:hypothetical protein
MSTDYYNKYQKYKLKYLNGKNMLGRGEQYFDVNNLSYKNIKDPPALAGNQKNYTGVQLYNCKEYKIKDNQLAESINVYNSFPYVDNYISLFYSITPTIFAVSYLNKKIGDKDVYFLRNAKFNPVFDTVTDFMNSIKQYASNITYNDEAKMKQLDKQPAYRSNLVSTNISLFGNYEYPGLKYHNGTGFNSGESTFGYYLTSGTQLNIAPKRIAVNFFFKFYPILAIKYMQKVMDLIIIMGKANKGRLIEVLIPSNKFDENAYVSYAYGIPALFSDGANFIMNSLDPKNKEKEFAQLEKQLLINSQFYDKLQPNEFFDRKNNSCVDFNELQARIVITKNLFKENDIKIRFGSSANLADLDRLGDEMRQDVTMSFNALYPELFDKLSSTWFPRPKEAGTLDASLELFYDCCLLNIFEKGVLPRNIAAIIEDGIVLNGYMQYYIKYVMKLRDGQFDKIYGEREVLDENAINWGKNELFIELKENPEKLNFAKSLRL